MTNVFNQNTKQLLISPVNTNTTVELGALSWEKRVQNELNDFAKPSTTPNEVERRIQNMNRIQEVHTWTALVSDEFVKKSEASTISDETKEGVEEVMDNYMRLLRLINVEYGHIDESGYITEYSVEESASEDNSVFRITFNLLVGVPMSS